MKRYREHIIQSSEKRVQRFLKNQILDVNRIEYGGLPQTLIDVKPTVYALSDAVACYYHESSKYHKDKELYERICLALDFIQRLQRPDGTFDYPSCNFMSAPDTAFCLERLIAAYKLAERYGRDNESKILKDKYLTIIKDAALGVMAGGFHTPNHRWAITAALMQCSHLFKDKQLSQQLLDRVNEYLAEGIDGNQDGEYAERSTGTYNGVVNIALISIYEETNDETYLEYVRKNLKMMLTYIEPDDTIFTQNSTRQDKGHKQYADNYFYQYLYLASKYGIEDFDKAAHKIISDNKKRNDEALDCLHLLMLQEQLQGYEFKGYGFLSTYRRYFEESGVVRVKTQEYTYSLLKNANKFLFFQVGTTCIYMKIGVSYCSSRNFKIQDIEFKEGRTILKYKANGWYYLPFGKDVGTSDWWKMDHSQRKILNNSELEVRLELIELEDGLDILIQSEGCDKIPVRVEIGVPPESILENEFFYIKTVPGKSMILRQSEVTLHHEEQHISIGPGFGKHEFEGHYSGEEKNDYDYTLMFNDYTNLNKRISFKIK